MLQNAFHAEKSAPLITEKKKILFASVPADGHVNPLTGLAHYLQSLGHDVRWYTSPLYAPKLRKLNIHHYPFQKAMDVNGTNLESVFPERNVIKSQVSKLNFDIINVFVLRGPEYYTDMMEIRKEFDFELLIADCAFSGIPFVKDKMKIPVVSVGVFPLTESSRDLPPNGLGMTPSSTFFGRIKQGMLRFFADRVLFRESNRVLFELMKKYRIPYNGEGIFDLLVKKSDILLQSGTPGFEYQRSDLGKNIRFVGALLPYSTAAAQSWFDERMNQYKKIVLVTQGTVEKDVEKLLVPTLEAFKGTDTLVIATTGGSSTAELKKRYPENNLIIEDFIPFADVMPYADVYITNGGYGGVMLGIENELPLLVAGVHEGKNEINARIGFFRLGVNLQTEKPSVEKIRAGVTEVIGNPVYKQNIKTLASEFKTYDPYKLSAGYVQEVLTRSAMNKPRLATAN